MESKRKLDAIMQEKLPAPWIRTCNLLISSFDLCNIRGREFSLLQSYLWFWTSEHVWTRLNTFAG